MRTCMTIGRGFVEVYVITCLDGRTDPSAFLELELGSDPTSATSEGR